MNALSTLTMKRNLRSKSGSARNFRSEETLGREAVRQVIGRFGGRPSLNGTSPDYRLGDIVRHARYGTGRVMAQLPDGRLQIRFEGVRKSQMIFPSLLQR